MISSVYHVNDARPLQSRVRPLPCFRVQVGHRRPGVRPPRRTRSRDGRRPPFLRQRLNGPLDVLDKQSRQFTVYLDLNGLGGRPGLFPKFAFERNSATGLTNFAFDPDYVRNGVLYTFAVLKRGVPSTMMAGFDGVIPDETLRSVVRYLRTLAVEK